MACAYSVDMSEAGDDDADDEDDAGDDGPGGKEEGKEEGGKDAALPPVPPVMATPADGIIQPYQVIVCTPLYSMEEKNSLLNSVFSSKFLSL